MEHVWTILIEFAFLGLVAYGYYIYQKRKILRNDKINIYETLTEMIIDMDTSIKKEESSKCRDELSFYTSQLKEVNEEQNFQKLVELLGSPPNKLGQEFTDSFPSIIDQVSFHIKKK